MANGHYGDRPAPDHLVMTALSAGDAAAVIDHIEWLRAINRSPNTIHDRTHLLIRLDCWLGRLPEPKTLGTASEDDLAKWQRAMARKSPQTVATYVGHAVGYYRWLAKYHHAPDASALLVRPTVPRGLPRPISDSDLQDVLQIAQDQLLLIFLLMAFCGLRIGEISRLQRNDIRDGSAPPVVIVNGKGGKQRIVRMPNDLGGQLQAVGLPVRGWVLTSPRGGPYTPNRLSQIANAFLHDHGIPDTAHSVRHWYGTHAYRITRDLRLVQEMMGHASPTTTAVYTAYDPRNADTMAAGLDSKIDAMLNHRHLRVVGDDAHP